MLRLPMIVLITALSCQTGFAQPANSYMPGCRDYLARRYDLAAGGCSGFVLVIAYAHPMICPPERVTHGQIVRVVVQYIDRRPARLHEDFRALAVEALRAAWPCMR